MNWQTLREREFILPVTFAVLSSVAIWRLPVVASGLFCIGLGLMSLGYGVCAGLRKHGSEK